MATLVVNCDGTSTSFENNGNIRVTYTAGNGSVTITEIEGMRTDGYSSYEDASQTIKIAVGGVEKTINVTRVRFMANSSYATWGLTDTTWTGLSGKVNFKLSGLTHYSGAAYYNRTFTANSAIDAGSSTYYVYYNACGGTGAPATQTVSSQIFTVSSTKPTYTGHTFLGWSMIPHDTASRYSPGGSCEMLGATDNFTLYAVWSQVPLIKVKSGSSWNELTGQVYVKKSGTWISVDDIKLKTNGDF